MGAKIFYSNTKENIHTRYYYDIILYIEDTFSKIYIFFQCDNTIYTSVVVVHPNTMDTRHEIVQNAVGRKESNKNANEKRKKSLMLTR